MKIHGLLLFSGGLDSIIAAELLKEQNLSILGIHFILPFEIPGYSESTVYVAKGARRAGIELLQLRCGDDYLKMLAAPVHGYGKNINPCIDCKIYFLKKASVLMKLYNAYFVATGEVNGQRPMSQRRDMIRHIEREAGLEGKILRPLSAGFFSETEAEKKGIVNRDMLLSIHGRGRTQQMQLADKYGITEYSSPAGGCSLTDPNFSRRVKDLLKHSKLLKEHDLFMLRIGRHFRLGNSKLILSRNEKETEQLCSLSHLADYFLDPHSKGPVGFICGIPDNNDMTAALDTLSSYCRKEKGESFTASIVTRNNRYDMTIEVSGGKASPL